ncbi:hypothetical protein [Granulicella arctica]|uniref:Uncharacterized protein n=1 Tax=Granulicella arctica TaxID=940613 RepID=A0A7Y9TFB5_9BACT|nr:hypothetical protein [Granulicella arctica]NYF78566.1 hypothetical protein [Granulicella arctica]
MENAKDTFYIMLRDRLTALNPERTISVRGVVRPGVLVEENELVTDAVVPDAFTLRWTALAVDPRGPLPLTTLTCEIRYATDGNAGNAGMDRGRLLAAMDVELSSALRAAPHHVVKMNYAGSSVGVAPVAMATNIFWSDVTFAPTVTTDEQLSRVATVEVFCYQEAGEQ